MSPDDHSALLLTYISGTTVLLIFIIVLALCHERISSMISRWRHRREVEYCPLVESVEDGSCSNFVTKDRYSASEIRCNLCRTYPGSYSEWRRAEVIIGSWHQYSTFLRFFKKDSAIQGLSLSIKPLECRYMTISQIGINKLNDLLSQLLQLHCFSLISFDLRKIILPPNIEHLNLYIKDRDKTFAKQIHALHCSSVLLTHLGLFGKISSRRDRCEDIDAVSLLLLKYQASITSLHLQLGYIDLKWINLIAECPNLQVLKVTCSKKYSNMQCHVESLAKMPQLQHFSFQYMAFDYHIDLPTIHEDGIPDP